QTCALPIFSPATLAWVLVISAVMLAIALAVSWWGGRALGLTTEDRIALLMCGSQKSLATGLPMLGALFPAALAGPIAVPVIVFHQLQLIVSSVLARRPARRPASDRKTVVQGKEVARR